MTARIPRVELAALVGLLAIAAILRLYRLPDLLILGVDQGRDALLVTEMLRTGQPIIDGSPSMALTFNRSPAFYYLLAPALALSGGHPVGGALVNVVLDLAAIAMAFVLVRALVNPLAGLVAAGLWAVSPLMVTYARVEWNPQAVPFFLLLSVYAALRVGRGEGSWLAVLVPAFLLAFQMHEQSLFLLPLLAVVLAYSWRTWLHPRVVALAAAMGVLALAPFLVQQLSNGFRDLAGMVSYIVGAALGSGDPAVASPVQRIWLAVSGIREVLPEPTIVRVALAVLVVIGLAWIIVRFVRQPRIELGILVMLAATPLLYAFWRAPFLTHYLFAIFPLPLIFAGVGVGAIAEQLPARWRPALATLTGIAIVVAALPVLAEIHGRALDPQRFDARVALARDLVADAGGPLDFQLVARRERADLWPQVWRFTLLRAGADLQSGPEVPTYVIYDPADQPGATGGHVVDGIRWVQLPPP